jgi:glycosyltransferase involved in cell wall biosynthesis
MFIVAHNGARLWGGAERSVALLLAGLQQRGHRVLLLCNDRTVADPAGALGVPVEIVPLGGDVALHHAAQLAVRLRRMEPDALLIGTFKKAWLAGLAGRMAGVPRIVARIGLQSDVPRNAKYHFAFRRLVDHVVVVAERLRPAYQAFPGLGPQRVWLIPNAVHPPVAVRPVCAVRTSLGIAPGAPCVGTVARLAGQKRLDRLLDAVALLPADVHCIVAGDGPLGGVLQRQATRLGIAGRVHLLGFRPDVGDVLAALDVFVLTSDQEGMSSAMLEAMAAGVPVVSTPVSGTDEALRPGRGGVAPGVLAGFDAAAVAHEAGALLRDPVRRAEMGAAGVLRAREDFGFPRVLDRWEQVLGRQGVPARARERAPAAKAVSTGG